MYQGRIRFAVAAECMKRFPCWCHTEPSRWIIVTTDWFEGKGIAYVEMPIHAELHTPWQWFAGAFDSLEKKISEL